MIDGGGAGHKEAGLFATADSRNEQSLPACAYLPDTICFAIRTPVALIVAGSRLRADAWIASDCLANHSTSRESMATWVMPFFAVSVSTAFLAGAVNSMRTIMREATGFEPFGVGRDSNLLKSYLPS